VGAPAKSNSSSVFTRGKWASRIRRSIARRSRSSRSAPRSASRLAGIERAAPRPTGAPGLLAPGVGGSPQSVHRVWQSHGLRPQRGRSVTGSRDPHFREQRPDVVGVSVHPPEPALGLCADAKSQIQALDRTPGGLARKKGRCGSMPPEHGRHGTTTLAAPLALLTGQRIGPCFPEPRHSEWLRCLRLIDRQSPPEFALHLRGDHSATHAHAARHRWLARQPRFHFLSTRSAWLHPLARGGRALTSTRLRRGGFQSVAALTAASEDPRAHPHRPPRAFPGTAKVEASLATGERARLGLRKTTSA